MSVHIDFKAQSVKCLNLSTKMANAATKDYMGSVRYLSKILPLSIIAIIRNRVDLNSTLFINKSVKHFKYVELNPEYKDPHQIRNVYFYALDAMNALKDRLLKEIFLQLSCAETGKVHDYYRFSVKYTCKSDIEGKPKNYDVLNKTVEWFGNLDILSGYEKLPSDTLMSIEITLKAAPNAYSLTTFEAVSDKGKLNVFSNKKEQFGFSTYYGKLETGHHTVCCYGTTKSATYSATNDDNASRASSRGLMQNNAVEDSQDISEYSQAKKRRIEECEDVEHPKKSDKIDDVPDSRELVEEKEAEQETISAFEDPESDSSELPVTLTVTVDENLRCPCELRTGYELIELMVCTNCGKSQHCPCIGFRTAANSPCDYKCWQCNPIAGSSTENDETLKQQIVMSRYNLSLILALKYNKLPHEVLARHLKKTENAKLLEAFIATKVLYEDGISKGYKCDTQRLITIVKKSFNKVKPTK